MIKKEFAKIGKHIMHQLSSYIENYQIVEVETDFLNAQNEFFHLVHEEPQVKKTVHVKKKRLSKFQVLQFLLYHFYPIDERGIIRGLSEKEIAQELGCSVRTVRNNNIALEEAGLICYSHNGKHLNVMILPYQQYFEEKGYGYMELPYIRFQELITIQNVNALRIELRQELIQDNHSVKEKYGKNSKVLKISFNDFKVFAPKYIHTKPMMEKILAKGTGAFKSILQGHTIFFTLKEGVKSGKTLKQEKQKQYQSIIESLLQKVITHFTKQDIQDFVQLAFEYGIQRVKTALETLVEQEFYSSDAEIIHNYGGKVRTMIRQAIWKENEEKVPVEIFA